MCVFRAIRMWNYEDYKDNRSTQSNLHSIQFIHSLTIWRSPLSLRSTLILAFFFIIFFSFGDLHQSFRLLLFHFFLSFHYLFFCSWCRLFFPSRNDLRSRSRSMNIVGCLSHLSLTKGKLTVLACLTLNVHHIFFERINVD